VIVHPVKPTALPDLGLPRFLFEFPFDTTRAALNLLYKNGFTAIQYARDAQAAGRASMPYRTEPIDDPRGRHPHSNRFGNGEANGATSSTT
jgi:hypothetical protein